MKTQYGEDFDPEHWFEYEDVIFFIKEQCTWARLLPQ